MIKERTLDDIINYVSTTKHDDYIIGINEMQATCSDGNSVSYYSSHFNSDVSPTKVAFSQINQMLIPGLNQFAQQVVSRGMADLYTNAFNRLASRSDRSCMVRTIEEGGDVKLRACLSPKYNRIDDNVVIESLIDAIGDKAEFTDRFKSIGGNVTDTRTFLKFVTREPVFTIHADGRDRSFSAGLIFSNSETGHGTCQVQVLMIDRYCNNGCIFSSTGIGTFRLIHSGLDVDAKDRIGHIAAPRFSNRKLVDLRSNVKTLLDHACNKDTFTKYLGLIQDTASLKIDSDDPDTIGKWVAAVGKQYDLKESEKEAVVARLIETGDRSLFGIQAALTDAAKYVSDYDRKIELEQIGGSILQNAPGRWETIRKLVD